MAIIYCRFPSVYSFTKVLVTLCFIFNLADNGSQKQLIRTKSVCGNFLFEYKIIKHK